MARIGLFNRLCGQHTNGVDGKLSDVLIHTSSIVSCGDIFFISPSLYSISDIKSIKKAVFSTFPQKTWLFYFHFTSHDPSEYDQPGIGLNRGRNRYVHQVSDIVAAVLDDDHGAVLAEAHALALLALLDDLDLVHLAGQHDRLDCVGQLVEVENLDVHDPAPPCSGYSRS